MLVTFFYFFFNIYLQTILNQEKKTDVACEINLHIYCPDKIYATSAQLFVFSSQ